ncbi:hypothetical protein BS47DRAFT_1394638 [Hydnum rufescens UP504]|uniref:Uncharacterized protein n=1 Tax=Hydnum rufescens UP504 TaxID=1448309 RepID=A0A9P6AV25_9AGAM|nr:hypothetical protein BS47DRAFT_1394638 [Hydnum rufescens UP504]
MPFSFLGKVSSLFQMSPPPNPIPSALSPQRKPISEWLEVKLFRVEPAVACTEFILNSLWHWESAGVLRHEGLTFEFIRHTDRATVYIKVDRLSYDNDPYSSSVKVFNSSGAGLAAESPDQDSDASLLKAKDWVQVLNRDERILFFRPSPAGTQTHSVLSLGTTTFSGAHPSVQAPNLIDVMQVVHAVSNARVEYGIWRANCWWLARSIRLCLELRWNRNPDSAAPNIAIVGFDTGMERITRDQVKIWGLYKVIDAKRVEIMNHTADMEAALQRADDAETVSRQNVAARLAAEAREREEREARIVEGEARIAAEKAHVAAEQARTAEREARVAAEQARMAAEQARIAVEEQLAKLEAQLRNASLHSSNA